MVAAVACVKGGRDKVAWQVAKQGIRSLQLNLSNGYFSRPCMYTL